jgi:hypothetical protein
MMASVLALRVALAVGAGPCAQAFPPEWSRAQRENACSRLARTASAAVADRSALEAIYSRPGFERSRDRSGDALRVLLERLQVWLTGLLETSGAVAYARTSRVLVLALAALLALWAALRALRRREAGARSPAPPLERALAFERPAQHLERARLLLESDARAALREGFLSLLAQLEHSRLARPDRAKTNRELAQELTTRGAPPELARALRAALLAYDEAFYSLAPVTPDAAAQFLEEVCRLRTWTQRGAAP